VTKVEVEWVETTRYKKVFELDFSDEDDIVLEVDEIHERMDHEDAWDQVSKKDWLGGAIVGVEDREVTEAKLA
jgi:hypothetical protein